MKIGQDMKLLTCLFHAICLLPVSRSTETFNCLYTNNAEAVVDSMEQLYGPSHGHVMECKILENHSLTANVTETETELFQEGYGVEETESYYFPRIFSWVEAIQRDKIRRPFGRVLDAGTGSFSLGFLAHLYHRQELTDFTAVTAMNVNLWDLAQDIGLPANPREKEDGWDEEIIHRQEVEDDFYDDDCNEEETEFSDDCVGIVIGNWNNDTFCEGEQFDTILADYLVGSMDAFSPYLQYDIIDRLAKHLKPGGTLYIIGMEPLEDEGTDPNEFVSRMRRIRDAIILFSGKRYYREYPLSWMVEEVKRSNLVLKEVKKFDIHFDKQKILGQLEVAKDYLNSIPYKPLRDELAAVIRDMENELGIEFEYYRQNNTNDIVHSFDYLLAAYKPTLRESTAFVWDYY